MNQETYIEKANLPLRNGESLDQYVQSIGTAVQSQYGKPGKSGDGLWTYLRAVYADSVVFELNGISGSSPIVSDYSRKLLQANYSLNSAGEFIFDGVPIEVRQVTAFEPISKEQKSVMLKAQNLWSGLSLRPTR
jgi:hypothetical protein